MSNTSAGNQSVQLDPARDFCARYWHSSCLKNGTIYIDGGYESYQNKVNGTPTGNITFGYNLGIVTIDVSVPFDWNKNMSAFRSIQKTPVPGTGNLPPSLVLGALYEGPRDQPNIYSYGGDISYGSNGFPGFNPTPDPASYALWAMNTSSKGYQQYAFDNPDLTERPSNGAAAEAPDLGLAFYLNGKIDGGSSQATIPLGSGLDFFLPGMVVINTTDLTATNRSTQTLTGDSPLVMGAMHYVPPLYGSHGLLVAMGGRSKRFDDPMVSDGNYYIPLDRVGIFDVGSLFGNGTGDEWYWQNTTGLAPSPRGEFCLVGAAAPDNSSYNIYLYGGRNTTALIDDVWILSLPSMTWKSVWNGSIARAGHTCHRASSRHMVTVGGLLQTYYTACDWETQDVGIYDMTELRWGSVFDPDAAPYEVPRWLDDALRDDATGAPRRVPAGGFATPEVARLFGANESDVSPAYLAAHGRGDGGGAIGGGAIAGAVVGAVCGTLLLAGAAVSYRYRDRWWPGKRRRAKGQDKQQAGGGGKKG